MVDYSLCRCEDSAVFIKVIRVIIDLEECQYHCEKCKLPITKETQIY